MAWPELVAQAQLCRPQSPGSFPVHGKSFGVLEGQLPSGFGLSEEPRPWDLDCSAECVHLRGIKHTCNLSVYISLKICHIDLYILTNQMEN